MEIGIRELRDQLSRHLAEVREGRTVTVTDHGRPIARIVPVERPTKLESLREEGRVQRARTRKQPAPAPLATGSTVSDLVGDQRR
ncbi:MULTISPECIES: type II toxin-antitoxin system Phd/YefM family antitoxin [Mycolicibacterium]|uniref:Antitoxin n=1 Tax=Mycolicibacterium gilvum TaxID=1804 RepID=A0A378SNN5_9MYCO|nr:MULTISPECIES: type II toxin-antitoxin system prevent-host-death family antitoxin [Mycolicibacterium]MBV5246756.1 type II toxin-antitoxin system prevent-host-death family antitoxin [Mycolicibacterium sp. PAM1]MCV7053718.1 type II toxin-antitoxin system prevent-host-death family antitoxin [Mycolicibacterium gilvum]STZ43965.1 prevent-host-death family protein [Mycolicibacterium gilvum]